MARHSCDDLTDYSVSLAMLGLKCCSGCHTRHEDPVSEASLPSRPVGTSCRYTPTSLAFDLSHFTAILLDGSTRSAHRVSATDLSSSRSRPLAFLIMLLPSTLSCAFTLLATHHFSVASCQSTTSQTTTSQSSTSQSATSTALTIQDDWILPAKPSYSEFFHNGDKIRIEWTSHLYTWFENTTPDVDPVKCDFWITGWELHQYEHVVASEFLLFLLSLLFFVFPLFR